MFIASKILFLCLSTTLSVYCCDSLRTELKKLDDIFMKQYEHLKASFADENKIYFEMEHGCVLKDLLKIEHPAFWSYRFSKPTTRADLAKNMGFEKLADQYNQLGNQFELLDPAIQEAHYKAAYEEYEKESSVLIELFPHLLKDN